MSRTWRREPSRRNRSEYVEMQPYGDTKARLTKKKEKPSKEERYVQDR